MEYSNGGGCIISVGGNRVTPRNTKAWRELDPEKNEFREKDMSKYDLGYYVKTYTDQRDLLRKAIDLAADDLGLGNIELVELRDETIEESLKRIGLNDFDNRIVAVVKCRGYVRRDLPNTLFFKTHYHNNIHDLLDTIFHEMCHLYQYKHMPELCQLDEEGKYNWNTQYESVKLEEMAENYARKMTKMFI